MIAAVCSIREGTLDAEGALDVLILPPYGACTRIDERLSSLIFTLDYRFEVRYAGAGEKHPDRHMFTKALICRRKALSMPENGGSQLMRRRLDLQA